MDGILQKEKQMIKKCIMGLALSAILATSSLAFTTNGDMEARNFMAQFEYCEKIEEVGMSIYSTKMEGMPKEPIMNTLNTIKDVPPAYINMMRKLVNLVYNITGDITEEEMKEIIFVTCMMGDYDM